MENVLLFVLVAAGAGFVVWHVLNAYRTRAWDEAQRRGWRERVAADPQNCGAWEALGDSLRRAGRLDEARDAYLGALEAGGDTHALDTTQAKLRAVDEKLRERARGGGTRPPAEMNFCRACGTPNPPFRFSCELCGKTLAYATWADALRDPEVKRGSLQVLGVAAVLALLLQWGVLSVLQIAGLVCFGGGCAALWHVYQNRE